MIGLQSSDELGSTLKLNLGVLCSGPVSVEAAGKWGGRGKWGWELAELLAQDGLLCLVSQNNSSSE